MLGEEGDLLGRQYTVEVQEKERRHTALRYEPPADGDRWRPTRIPPGRKLKEPRPLFRKLDESLAEVEVQRMLERAAQ